MDQNEQQLAIMRAIQALKDKANMPNEQMAQNGQQPDEMPVTKAQAEQRLSDAGFPDTEEEGTLPRSDQTMQANPQNLMDALKAKAQQDQLKKLFPENQ